MRAVSIARILIITGAFAGVAACALNVEGTNFDSAQEVADAGPQPDASAHPDAPIGPAPSDCTGVPTDCTDSVPAGWQRVGYAEDRSMSCDESFTTFDVDADPDTTNACACGACSVTAQPSCPTDNIGVHYDDGGQQCQIPFFAPVNIQPGQCVPFPFTFPLGKDIKVTPQAPTGGDCFAQINQSPISSTQARLCLPKVDHPACDSELCAKDSTFDACIRASGDQSCPEGPFQKRHLVGTGIQTLCSNCGCSIEGACSGTLTLHTQSNCQGGSSVSFFASSTCVPTNTNDTKYAAATYQASLASSSCKVTAPSSATLQFAELHTVCCR